MISMSDKIKKILQTPDVPDEIKPENIPHLIKRQNIQKSKNKNIIKYISALAACAVVALCAVNFIPDKKDLTLNNPAENKTVSDNLSDISNDDSVSLYFKSVDSYDDIYSHMKKNYKKQNETSIFEKIFGSKRIYNEMEITDGAVDAVDEEYEYAVEDTATDYNYNSDVYDTIEQVEGVDEADIIKANSNNIFFAKNSEIICIPVNNSDGSFGEKNYIDVYSLAQINPNNINTSIYISDMYLTENKLIAIADIIISSNDDYYYTTNSTEIFTFDISDGSAKFENSYYQSGSYSDSRMKDNILYLTTNQYVNYTSIEDEHDYKQFIPVCGSSYNQAECIDTDSLCIPENWENSDSDMNYVNISGIDIDNVSEPVSIVSIAGYSGNLYCSGNNIYIAQKDYNNGTTEITRFSMSDGIINPETSGYVNGSVLNQFSMDEFNGYFRIATTSSIVSRSNNIFVLDMNMNIVGSVTDIAPDESIKSVNFNGNTGYIVTYQQTDPLFAIDFSDPFNPVITDEFKINGYSSFIYPWSNDLLLGFGIDADSSGYELGVKLVMFDVSDNGNLNECGFYSISSDTPHGIMSDAVYNRKALLLNSDRNLIGFPVTDYNPSYQNEGYPINYYKIFSYENGEFIEKASISAIYSDFGNQFLRGVYIGNYMYILSDNEAVSVDLNSFEEVSRTEFDQ